MEAMVLARRLAYTTVLATLALIALGVIVRATGSGLGCPDWPTCYDGVIPPGDKHPIIEMSHRYLASTVGLLVIALAVVSWRSYRGVPIVVPVALATVPLVGIQGLIGAVTVKRELPPEIVATHLITAFGVLTCLMVVAVAMTLLERRPEALSWAMTPAAKQLGKWSLVSLGVMLVTACIGGYMTESGASAACSGWPFCNGSPLPGSDDKEIVHMVHRYLVVGLTVLILRTAAHASRQRESIPWAGPWAVGLVALFVAQVTLGALNVWLTFPDALAVGHTVVASLIWAVLSFAAVVVYLVPVLSGSTVRARAAGAPA